ncbi:MAG TPA: hypothetical protein VGF89_14945 [Steroidobacteraceae bacterium]|jgi:hypothetical protein
MLRSSAVLAVAMVLCGCAGLTQRPPQPPPHADSSAEDRDTAAAMVMGSTFQTMQRLAQAPAAEQAELLAAARTGYERSPQGGAQLRYALLLATPGHPGRDAPKAQMLLRQLVAQPETLVPIERAVALVELAQLDRELGLKAENDRMQATAQHDDRDRVVAASASQRRLQSEIDENAKLRKQLEDAQAKLDAIANIERNLTDRKSPVGGASK